MVDTWNPAQLNEGIKTSGSGGGTQVEANPEGSATETLNKIGIGGTIYNVSMEEKTFTYTGDGVTHKSITFPEAARYFYITGVANGIPMNSDITSMNSCYVKGGYYNENYEGELFCRMTKEGNVITLSGNNVSDVGNIYNHNNVEFTVHYIV